MPRWILRIDRRILVTTLVSMLVAAVVGGSIAAMGLGLIFVTDACDVDAYVCRDSLFTIGYGIAVAGPLFLTGIAVIVALVGMIRGRTRPWLVLLIGVGRVARGVRPRRRARARRGARLLPHHLIPRASPAARRRGGGGAAVR